jgi:hypothetical protein
VWDERNFKGETALFTAALEAKPYKVWWLLVRGADPNISSSTNFYAKHKHATALYAAWLGGSKACVQLITEYGGQMFKISRKTANEGKLKCFNKNHDEAYDVCLHLEDFPGRIKSLFPPLLHLNPLMVICPDGHPTLSKIVGNDDAL